MRIIAKLSVWCVCLFWFAQGYAQSTNTMQLGFSPPASTAVFIELTTNLLQVMPVTGTNFTNVTINATIAGTNTLIRFNDSGASPDPTAADGTYSGSIIPPKVLNKVSTNITVTYLITATDISDPDNGPSLFTTNVVFKYTVVARPENDNFTNAFKLPSGGGVVFQTNNYASLEAGEPQHAGVPTISNSVWWNYSSPFTTLVLLDTAGSSFAPVLVVYTNATFGTLQGVVLSTNDVVNNLKANTVFNAYAGVTYRIAISGYNTNGVGSIRLRVLPGGKPDTTPPVVTILTPANQVLVTTNVVTLSGTAKDALNDSGVSQVSVQVNNLAPLLASGSNNWTITLNLPPGTNVVRAFAKDIAGNISAPDSIVIRYLNPTNDYFATATPLAGFGGLVSTINGRATKEPGEPNHAGNDGGHSIWYSFHASVNGILTLETTTNTTFDTLLAAYTGDSLTNLSLIASNDDEATGLLGSLLAIPVVSGQNYYIAMDGYAGYTGNLEFTYSFTTTDRYFSLTVAPPQGGSVWPTNGLYLAGSQLALTATPQRDFAFVGWQGSVTSSANPLVLQLNANLNLAALFRVVTYSDTFESHDLSGLSWSTTPGAPWFVQSDSASAGQYAIRSGVIADGRQSSLQLITNTFAGMASFDYRISSEENWDLLEFYLNGTRLGRWSGEVAWTSFQYQVPAGTNVFEWRYSKDSNFAAGLDAAFIDNVYIPIIRTNPSAAAKLGYLTLPDGRHQIQVRGLQNQTYAVQASADLRTWSLIGTNASPDGTFVLMDGADGTNAARFYRAVSLP